MFKKTVLSIITALFLVKMISAQEVVSEKSSLSPLFYIIILSVLFIVGLIIFFIKKLDYDINQILKSVGISLLITLIIEILIFIFFKPTIYCGLGESCPSSFEYFLGFLPYTAATIFLITILIYYIVKFIKNL